MNPETPRETTKIRSESSWEAVYYGRFFQDIVNILQLELNFAKIQSLLQRKKESGGDKNLDKEIKESFVEFTERIIDLFLRNSMIIFGTSDIFPNVEEIFELDSVGRFISSYQGKYSSFIKENLSQLDDETKEGIFNYIFGSIEKLLNNLLSDLEEKSNNKEIINQLKQKLEILLNLIKNQEDKEKIVNFFEKEIISIFPHIPFKVHLSLIKRLIGLLFNLYFSSKNNPKEVSIIKFLEDLKDPHCFYFIHFPVHPYDLYTPEEREEVIINTLFFIVKRDYEKIKNLVENLLRRVPYYFPFVPRQIFDFFEIFYSFEEKLTRTSQYLGTKLNTVRTIIGERELSQEIKEEIFKKINNLEEIGKSIDSKISFIRDIRERIIKLLSSEDMLVSLISAYYLDKEEKKPDTEVMNVSNAIENVFNSLNNWFKKFEECIKNFKETDISRERDINNISTNIDIFIRSLSENIKELQEILNNIQRNIETILKRLDKFRKYEIPFNPQKVSPLSFLESRSGLYRTPFHFFSVREMMSYLNFASLRLDELLAKFFNTFIEELKSEGTKGRIIGYFIITYSKDDSKLKKRKQIPVRLTINKPPITSNEEEVYFWFEEGELKYHIQASDEIKNDLEDIIKENMTTTLVNLYRKGRFRLSGISIYYLLGSYINEIGKAFYPPIATVVSEEMGKAWKFFELGLNEISSEKRVKVFPVPFIRITFPKDSNLRDYPIDLHFLRNLIKAIDILSLYYLNTNQREDYKFLRKLSESIKELFTYLVPLIVKIFFIKLNKNIIRISTSLQENRRINPDQYFKMAFDLIFQREGMSDIKKLISLTKDEKLDLSDKDLRWYSELVKAVEAGIINIEERERLHLKIVVNFDWKLVELVINSLKDDKNG